MRALVPDAGAAAFEVLGGLGVAVADVEAVAEAFGVLEGLVGVGVGVCVGFGFGAVGFFDVVGLGVPAGTVGDCDAAGPGSLCPVPFQSRAQSLCSV
ncbi:hypothetical protein [Streptomyces sp. NBC_00103]|uniref:hypothetical protein n=1 Tax=Streptomyces sp. NBC_00103 TaxID=2975653 RepID=UPI002B1DE572|nr:hypothetical protein [Streptomyces sp. NBC_00103]